MTGYYSKFVQDPLVRNSSRGSQPSEDSTHELLVKLLGKLNTESPPVAQNNVSHTMPTSSIHPVMYATPITPPTYNANGPQLTPLVQPIPNTQSPPGFSYQAQPTYYAYKATQPGSLGCTATPRQAMILPHAFTVGTVHDPITGAWNIDTGCEVLRHLVSNNFISCNKEKPPVLCHACQLGKHVRLPFFSSNTIVTSCFDIIHSDVWTSPIPSLSGFKYYVLFLDHYSQFVWVYPLLNKSDVWSKFVLFRTYVRTQFKCEIRSFQCDHGGEFDNRNLHKLFAENGIQFRFSCPKTSQQNGKSERMVRTINNLIRTLLFQANLPPTFWVEALNVATHLLNFLPSTAINNEIPYTRMFGTNTDYNLLRTFGCLCYPHLYTNHKLEPRATPSIYLGQASNHHGYRCLDLKINKIIISRHVTFDEIVFPYGSTQPALPPTYTFLDDKPDIIPPAIPTNPALVQGIVHQCLNEDDMHNGDQFLRYIDTRPNGDALRKCILKGPYTPTIVTTLVVPTTEDSPSVPEQTTVETVMNMTPEKRAHFESEKEAIHLILTGIRYEIYSTVDACQQSRNVVSHRKGYNKGESLNNQDSRTNIFWSFWSIRPLTMEKQ
ncbi:ribonuclease H-like domain-containing protein [Tanacetum coccineum]